MSLAEKKEEKALKLSPILKKVSKGRKDKLLNRLRSKKGEGVKRTVENVGNHRKVYQSPKISGIIFSATFGEKSRAIVCADVGAEDKIMDNHTLEELEKSGVRLQIEWIFRPRIFVECAYIKFKHEVVIDTEMKIRRGPALILHGVRWIVTDQSIEETLLGRPVLEVIGHNTR